MPLFEESIRLVQSSHIFRGTTSFVDLVGLTQFNANNTCQKQLMFNSNVDFLFYTELYNRRTLSHKRVCFSKSLIKIEMLQLSKWIRRVCFVKQCTTVVVPSVLGAQRTSDQGSWDPNSPPLSRGRPRHTCNYCTALIFQGKHLNKLISVLRN